ncbi:MAG TPA: T9SS type A sorting domain-containing protein, partial [Lentimicrobium sp.]|nr:T9SS type A sorting domain-containing protein [Lentimicrobium sp.]
TGDYYNPNSAPMVYQRDPFVLKLNSEGLIVNVDNHEEPIAQEALVLPNPGREFLQVKLAVQHKSAHFQLFDLGGRLVLETDLSRDIKQIGTAQLGSGAYIYRITASNRVIGSGKWVKE